MDNIWLADEEFTQMGLANVMVLPATGIAFAFSIPVMAVYALFGMPEKAQNIARRILYPFNFMQ